MEEDVKQEVKKAWDPPVLIVHGTVETLTQARGCDKSFGGSDGFTFHGIPIQCVS